MRKVYFAATAVASPPGRAFVPKVLARNAKQCPRLVLFRLADPGPEVDARRRSGLVNPRAGEEIVDLREFVGSVFGNAATRRLEAAAFGAR